MPIESKVEAGDKNTQEVAIHGVGDLTANTKTKIHLNLNSQNPIELIQNVVATHPEMMWLTGDVAATPEAGHNPDEKGTIAEQIFHNVDKSKLTEFNRTAVGILILKWITEGDYNSFTACQKENVRLSRQSFQELQSYVKDILPDQEAIEAMITFMVINDLTKVKAVVADLAKRSGIENVDHDKLLLVALRDHPEVSPSFQRLSLEYQGLMLDGLRAEFNIGQFIQGENVPASLDGLKSIDEKSLKFFLLHALCDIAGAAGQFVQNGSAVMTEPTYQGFKDSISSIEGLSQGQTPDTVYDSFLGKRSSSLELDITQPRERAITRVCCMLRFSTLQEAKQVSEAWDSLPKNTQAILEAELNKNGTEDGFATLIYYSPALLVNLQKSMNAQSSPESFQNSLKLGLTTLARIYQESRIALKKRQGNGVYTVMASGVAKMASENPNALNEHDIVLKSIGEDAEIELKPFSKIDHTKFEKISRLNEIPGNTIVPIGIGGGSDCIQAFMLGKLLQAEGKNIPAIISVRTAKTGSQGLNGKLDEDRTPKNATKIADGIFLINPSTEMNGRALEPLISDQILTYLILIDEEADVTKQLTILQHHIGNINTIIGVDTGGDALYSTSGHDQAKATPDQDILVLKAIDQLEGVTKFSCEIATGIDTPENGEEVLIKAGARYFEPTSEQAQQIIDQYEAMEMNGTNDQRFGKTALSWQKALNDETGLQCIDLPTRVVVDTKNPWKTFVNIEPSTKGLFFMSTHDHLSAISTL